MPDVTGEDQTAAGAALLDAGFKVDSRTQHVTDPAEVGKVQRQKPSGGKRAKRGSSVTIYVGTAAPADTTTTPPARPRHPPARPRRREGRGPGGRPLVRARGVACQRGHGPRRAGRGRPRGPRGHPGPRRHLVAGGGGARRCGPVAACSAPMSSSRSCTARGARTAPSRGCSSCSTSPTSAPACWPARRAWTRSSSRSSWPRRACRRSPTSGSTRATASRRACAALGLPCWVKPARLGSSVGIVRVAAADEVGAALDVAFGHDPRVIVEASATGLEVECAVLGPTHAPEASVPGEIVLTDRGRLVRLRGQVHPGRRWSWSSPRASRRPPTRARPRAGLPRLHARRLQRPGARGLLRRRRRRRCSTSSTRCPARRPRAPTASSGRRPGVPYPEVVDRLCAIGVARHARRARPRVLTAARRAAAVSGVSCPCAGRARSRRSRRSRARAAASGSRRGSSGNACRPARRAWSSSPRRRRRSGPSPGRAASPGGPTSAP